MTPTLQPVDESADVDWSNFSHAYKADEFVLGVGFVSNSGVALCGHQSRVVPVELHNTPSRKLCPICKALVDNLNLWVK